MGPPCCLISDQGTNFLSAAMNDVYDILGIYKAHTTAWHPQCNGNTEQVNKTLCDMIAKRFNMRGGDWDLLAPMCTYNYNIAVHSVIMMSLLFLKNGQEARVPVILALGTIEWNNNTELASYARMLLEQMCWFQHHNLHHTLISLLILFILFLLFSLYFRTKL